MERIDYQVLLSVDTYLINCCIHVCISCAIYIWYDMGFCFLLSAFPAGYQNILYELDHTDGQNHLSLNTDRHTKGGYQSSPK